MTDFPSITIHHGDCLAKMAAMEAEHRYPHMCRDGHPQIGHSTDGERCPVCLERDRAEQAEADRDALMKRIWRRDEKAEGLEAELAALKARRCETCGRLPGGCCIAEDLEIFSESPTPYCSRWAERITK